MNCYVVLGVRPDAGSETIRSAFRALVRRYHPDAGKESSADRFRQIVSAYETLNDPDRRKQHDRHLRHADAEQPRRFVEPLTGPTFAEPLLRPRPWRPAAGRRYESTEVIYLDQVVEDVFWVAWCVG